MKLVESGDITLERAAQKTGMTVEELNEKARCLGYPNYLRRE